MENKVFYKKNGGEYKNPKTWSISLYNRSTDKIAKLRNSLIKRVLNRRRTCERDTILCSISGKPIQLFVDYPVLDGVLVFMKKKPCSKLVEGIDYTVLKFNRQKYYIFSISLDSLVYILKRSRSDLEKKIVMGRIYSKRAFLKKFGLQKKDNISKFLVHSKSLYHNGNKISYFINKYKNIKRGVEEWDEADTIKEVETAPQQTSSWWKWW